MAAKGKPGKVTLTQYENSKADKAADRAAVNRMNKKGKK